MKVFLRSARICQYQLCILSKNFKIFTVPVCMLIFMWNTLLPFRDFLNAVQEKATPFLLPFLFTDEFLTALLFAGVLLFFVDAPFYDETQLFVIMRSGVKTWILGQIFYVAAISVLYMVFVLFMSFVMLIPSFSFHGEWGRIWTTLAVTEAGSDFHIPFSVPGDVVFQYSPFQAMAIVWCLGVLVCMFYGLLMWCLNLYFGRFISLSAALASIFLVTRIRFFPTWVMYLVPSAWMNIGNLSVYAVHKISIFRAFMLLLLSILCLGLLAFYKTARSDIAVENQHAPLGGVRRHA